VAEPCCCGTAPRDDTGAILRTIRRPVVALLTLAVVGVLGYVVVSALLGQSRARWAREQAIPEIGHLLQVDDYENAYQLAQQADRYIPNDPVLAGLLPQITGAPMFSSVKPDGARVYAKPYKDPKAEWRLLGTAPLENVRLPRGTYRWRIQADGFDSAEFARNVGDRGGPPGAIEAVQLVTKGSVPGGMVAVGASRGPVDITGFATEDSVSLSTFAIDRHEVTNREFKAFVQAGGYARREYWKHDFVRDGARLSWDEAMMLFRDSSGRSGPATWELGDFPAGQAEYPVGGVSWYEAAAYAEFRGASLPMIYHWARAALAFTRAAPIRGLIVETSNFAGKGPGEVESTGALGPYGTYDMAGNVREWCMNLSGENRWILGGAWNDHSYMYVVPYSLPPLDRSPMNGFRLAKYADNERVAELSKPIQVFRRDFREAKPVSDEVFQVFKRQFAYVPSPTNAKVEQTDRSSPDWVREKVTLDTGYGERMTTYVFTPKNGRSLHQAVVLFPGLGQFLSQTNSERISANDFGLDFIPKSGRVLVAPVWKGSYERFDGFVTLTGDRYLQTFRQRMVQWRQEMGQLIDYLATRPDVDSGKLAYTGLSFGSSTALPLLGLEPRFKVAVLQLAGFTYRDLLPEVEAVNYAPRITIPVLMLEARSIISFRPTCRSSL
jgi:dienelactone hydrolase